MEGLAIRQVLRPVPSSATSACVSPSSSSSSCSRTVGIRKNGALPSSAFGGRSGARQRCSPVLKIQASKKTFTSFDDMISHSKVPVLVDFYATWCGPCQFMAPILKDVGAALKDKISVVKVDTEKYPQVASRYGIQALPTFVLFVNGKAINVLEGAQPKDALIAHINQTLDAQKANVKY